MMRLLARIPSSLTSHWAVMVGLVGAAIGIVVLCRSFLETRETRDKRTELSRKKELRRVADRISTYGRKVHQRYPSGDVVVSVHDLAQQLRKRPDAVASALTVLLAEQKVEQTAVSGYWKLHA